MVTIGGLPDGLIIKRDGENLFEFPTFWVLAKSREEAMDKVEEFHRGQEDVKKFLEYDRRPLTEKEIAHLQHCREVYDSVKVRSLRGKTNA